MHHPVRTMRTADPGGLLSWMRLCAVLLALLLAAAVAGCGGGDDNGSDNGGGNGSTSGGGNTASPAQAIIADAGLQICSREEEQIAQSTIGPGLQLLVDFYVGKTCPTKVTPNLIRVGQFDSRESVDSGAQKATTAYPNSVVMTSGALVIVVTGPQKDANAEAVGKAYTENTGSPVETVS
jgi:hypothetical protein